MKKLVIILVAAITLAACNKTETTIPTADNNILYAHIEQEILVRTNMDANNNILWSSGDQIVGFMKSSLGLQYEIAPSSVGKTSAHFDQVGGNGCGLDVGTEWDHNVVYYPYSDAVEAEKFGSNYSLSVVLPAEQTYAKESFGNGTMAMVAVSENNNITFRNILGGIKLQLKGTQIVNSITLQGKNSEKLSGAATVIAYTDETKPAITMDLGASTSVTLNCGGVQLNESTATEFIIVLPPVLFSQGFTVIVTDSEYETYTVDSDKANTVLRSSLLVMPAFKLGEIPGDDSDEGLVEGNEKEILLTPGGGRQTKANVSGVVDVSKYPAIENFDVYAYWANEQEGSWFTDATSFLTNNISGVEFVNKGAAWGGIEPYYWPKNGSLRFAAYSPASLDITHVLETDTYILNGYVQSHETDKTCDLLLAPTSSSKTVGDKVSIEFKHALAWIVFNVRAENAESANMFTINRITLKDVYTQADLQASMSDGIQANEWMNLESRKDYVVFDGNAILGDDRVVLETAPNGTIVIPQEETSVSIDYTLVQSGTTGNITIDLRSCLFWEPGRCYNYQLILGLDELSVSGSVTSIDNIFKDIDIL